MNNIVEVLPLVFTVIGVAFGFGKQAAAIADLRKDTDAIGTMHRDTIDLLSDMDCKLARLEERVNSLKENR